jgi:hypothetical protein
MVQIASTVGPNAVNLPDDVRAVQMLLNRYQPGNKPLLAVDGSTGPQTFTAIETFIASRTLVCAEPVIRPASPELEALNGGSVDRIAWGGVVDAAFKTRVTSISLELQVAVDFLMAAMAFESAGTFSASVPNAAGSGAVGLIQFMPATARGLGTSTAALAAMSATQQLDYVRLYFLPYSGRLHTLEDVYMAILYPAAIGKGASHVLFSSGTTAYAQNAGLDTNKDGSVTVGEAAAKVRQQHERGLAAPHLG